MTEMKWCLIVEHDNGIKGQRGFSDDYTKTKKEAEEIVRRMRETGITVYGYSIAKGE